MDLELTGPRPLFMPSRSARMREFGSSRGEIPINLRIGISGHRYLTTDHPGLALAIAEAMTMIQAARDALTARTPSTRVGLTVVSSLAEGADRVLAKVFLGCADTALAAGASELTGVDDGRLEVILPLEPDNYCADFESVASKAEFVALLEEATTVDTVKPTRSRDRAYEAAGRAVVDRSDVMVIMWDGQHARGRGGTAEIYRYAHQKHKSVIWIRVDERSAKMAESPVEMPPVLLDFATAEGIDRYNGERLSGPPFTDKYPLPADIILAAMPENGLSLVEHFSFYFVRADVLATRFQRRWFSANRLLYSLAALAVLAVAVQLLFAPTHEAYAWFEFGILAGVTIMLLVARHAAWHDRWISARYLAEQIRSFLFLALTGIRTLDDTEPSAGWLTGPASQPGWLGRALTEVWWTRPRHDLTGNTEMLRQILMSEWVEKQLAYHKKTYQRYRSRSRRLTRIAIFLFALSTGAALLHSLGAESWGLRPNRLLDFFSIVVPAVGAAFSGYGAQRDYMRHAGRSQMFAATLAEASAQFKQAASPRDIQRVALSLSRMTTSETSDWYSAVRVHDVDVP